MLIKVSSLKKKLITFISILKLKKKPKKHGYGDEFLGNKKTKLLKLIIIASLLFYYYFRHWSSYFPFYISWIFTTCLRVIFHTSSFFSIPIIIFYLYFLVIKYNHLPINYFHYFVNCYFFIIIIFIVVVTLINSYFFSFIFVWDCDNSCFLKCFSF